MAVERIYVVVCDKCSKPHVTPLRVRTASDARYLARKDGWRAPHKAENMTVLCPVCRTFPYVKAA